MEARTATARWTAAAGEVTFGAGHVGGLQAMVGGTQEEVPLKTVEGERRWTATVGLGKSDGGPGRDGRGPCESCLLGDTGERRQTALERPPHERQKVTLGGMGVRQDGQEIWGASESFWISGRSVCVPMTTIWLFSALPNVPNGPFPGRLPKAPLSRWWADTYRPQGRVSPATGAQKPRASRMLVRLSCRGAELGAKAGVR